MDGKIALLLLMMMAASSGYAYGAEPGAERSRRIIEREGKPGQRLFFWLESSLRRVYPRSKPGAERALELLAPRNAQVSFQACLRNDGPGTVTADCSVADTGDLGVRVRRVGFVPMVHATTDTPASELEGGDHIPGLVPDPLFPEASAVAGSYENAAFWITLRIPAEATPGTRTLRVRLRIAGGGPGVELTAPLHIAPLVLRPRRGFPVTHWRRGEAPRAQ